MNDCNYTLNIAHLYPEQLNMYGDRGNILALWDRCHRRGIHVSLTGVHPGDSLNPQDHDLYFMGGGQDAQQEAIINDLHHRKAAPLKEAADRGAVFLTICGGYQLLGHYYRSQEGQELKGLGFIDLWTEAGTQRMIGNVALRRKDGSTVVGFENHSGRTFLGEGVIPLGQVIEGFGNNGEDGLEGAVSGHLYGTYLHGSLLPKNPTLTDTLITQALQVKYNNPSLTLSPLTHALEDQAHQYALQLCAQDSAHRQKPALQRWVQSLMASR